MFKKSLAVVMAVIMVICSFSFSILAKTLPDYSMSDEQWDAYWQENKDNFCQMQLYVGADETQLNFVWHSVRTGDTPKVRIGLSEEMKVYSEFEGYCKNAEDGWQANYVTASGFEENSVYYYSYAVGDGEFSTPEMYRTLSTDSFKALYISDVQSDVGEDGYATKDAKAWNKLLTTALNNNDDISFILNCGDMTNNGNNALQWAGTMAPKALRNIPTTSTFGNHDQKGTNYQYYVNNPNTDNSLTTTPAGKSYYFRNGDVLFINLTSSNFNVFSQYSFVEKAINENLDAKWRVLMMHHDIYGTGHHAADNDNLLLQSVYSAICDEFQIDVCLTGHEHYYGRSYFMYDNKVVDMDYSQNKAVDPQGTIYFTASSATERNRTYDEKFNHEWLNFEYMSTDCTYSVIEFTSNTFTLETFDLNDNLIDSYSIEKTDTSYDEVDLSNSLLDTNVIDRLLRNFTGEFYVVFQVLYKVVDVVKGILSKMSI